MEISTLELKNYLKKNNTLFICGNGFSMNFDSSFGNIYDRLYENYKKIYKQKTIVYKFNNEGIKNKCKKSFENTKRYLESHKSNKINMLFEDALKFAKDVNENKKLKEALLEHGFIKEVNEFITSNLELNILNEISSQNDFKKINIEHWTMLIYFYYAIKRLENINYEFPSDNVFINAIEAGEIGMLFLKPQVQDKKVIKVNEVNDIIDYSIFNGLNTYYRFLFCMTIFNDGKYLNLDNLDKIRKLNLNKIKEFLLMFKSIITTNYDNIIENILKEEIEVRHIHGQFMVDREEFVFEQYLGLNWEDGNIKRSVSFSDILIGDGISKFYRECVNNSRKKEWIDRKRNYKENIFKKKIRENKINTICIFGLSIQNDEILLKSILDSLLDLKVESPTIIFCYFTENDKNQIIKEITNYIKDDKKYKNIKVIFTKSEEILKNYFNI